MSTFEELTKRWREDASTLRRRGGRDLAETLESAAGELAEAVRRWRLEELTVQDAAQESGYSQDHLRELVRTGTIPDPRPKGSQGRIRIRRADLPRKPGPPEARPVEAAVDELAGVLGV